MVLEQAKKLPVDRRKETTVVNEKFEKLEKEPLQILPCAEAEKIGRELISKYHGHLVNATLLSLTTNQVRKRKGKPLFAATKKVDPLLHHRSEAPFRIVIDEPLRMYAGPTQRQSRT